VSAAAIGLGLPALAQNTIRIGEFNSYKAQPAFLEPYKKGWELAVEKSNRDLLFVTAMLDRLEAEYCIDRNRVFATGFSNGAYFSHLLGCVMADRIAAIAPVSGGKRPAPCAPARPVPALIFHGRQDDIIDVADARAARDSWVQENGCGAFAGDACQVYAGCRDGAERILRGRLRPSLAAGSDDTHLGVFAASSDAGRVQGFEGSRNQV
jgi:hypothetical protein